MLLRRPTLAALLVLIYGLATLAARGEENRRPASAVPPSYAPHVAQLQNKLPQGFTVVVQPPFVVVGDQSPAGVQRMATRTVKWSVERLKAAYFDKDPAEILDIWLFKDKASYEKHAKELFGTEPETPFGYFSHTDHALVMNITTGGGTLVHEIVHAYMAANFPETPAWFNEGLASLYEQCGEEEGQIHGYTNWRLAGLQKAIRVQQVPSFKTLCSQPDRQFYEADKGANYAQSRYLCYYLQEQGLLKKFFHRFRENHLADPTGYRTLQEILGRRDMDAFQREWETFVLRLTFP